MMQACANARAPRRAAAVLALAEADEAVGDAPDVVSFTTLARAYAADRDHRTPAVRRAEWGGSEAELRELAFGVPELATCEWREHLVRMLAPESFPNFRGLGRYRAALALRALGARYAAPVACLCLALALALVAAAFGGARAQYS